MKKITVSMEKKMLIVTKAFYNKAVICGSDEYYALRTAMNENPEFTIEFKTVQKKTYSKLTFTVMEEYIKMQPNSETQLLKFAAVKRIAKAKNALYPLTKQWFLKSYPDYKVDEVKDAELDLLLNEAAIEAEAAKDLVQIAG